jgi:predicted SAM-dependent methyltransferase
MTHSHCYSCVVDNSPLFTWQCHIFVNTLRHNCNVDPANIYIHAIDPSSLLLNYLYTLGVNIIPVDRWGDGKYCNKLVQFDTNELYEADHVFLCDCDLAFASTIDELPLQKTLSGKIVDFPNPPLQALDQIFKKYECEKPELVDTYTDKSYKTNCNGGLYSIPGKYFKPIGKAWRKYASALLNDEWSLGLLGEKRMHVDQISFAMAVSDLNIPFTSLNEAYNFPTHITDFKDKAVASLGNFEPKVLHYHHMLDQCGTLIPFGNELVDASIQKVNSLLRGNFNNKIFWDFRYCTNPSLGSGIGSRGELQNRKRKLLKLFGVEKAGSVLDVGCGDGEVIKGLNFQKYTGLDISAESLKLHSRINPEAILLLSSQKEQADNAELVVCLDVLIHQDTAGDYHELFDFIVNKTKKRLIVSGYGSQENLDESSMCAYHEDLRESLENSGKFERVFKVAQYRNLDVLVAEKARAVDDARINPNDLDDVIVDQCLSSHPFPDQFLSSLTASRTIYGWHTKQYSRIFEYPWVLSQFDEEVEGICIAEFGAGISPLPLLLSMRGATVFTFDHGDEVGIEDIPSRNEWGYFDYSPIDISIVSKNQSLSRGCIPDESIDAWYSVSVIEHLPRVARLEILKIIRCSLKDRGRLLLTIDLCKDSENLWNYSEGREIEKIDTHGNLDSFRQELKDLGFENIVTDVHKMPDSERIDTVYISARKAFGKRAKNGVQDGEFNIDIGGQNNRNDQSGKWKIVDLHAGADIRMNLESDPLPLADGTVNNIYSSHCLEHIEPGRLRDVFQDMYRVLKVGGRIRIAVPSFLKGVFYYFFYPMILKRKMMPRLNSNTPDTKMSRLSSWFYTETNKINGTPGHKTAWDFELLKAYMQETGFTNIKKTGLGNCSPVFSGKDNPSYEAFSLYVEAVKMAPGSRKQNGSLRGVLKKAVRQMAGLIGNKASRDVEIIRESCLFDSPWYLHMNSDVKAAGIDPVEHYVTHGWREGREPSGLFNTKTYLEDHPELDQNSECPMAHSIRAGFHRNVDLSDVIPPQVLELIQPFNFRSVYELGNKKTGDIPYAVCYRSKRIEYTSIDLNGLDGAIPLDLSKHIDLPPRDVVMNIGTSEHVAAQEEAFGNIHNLSISRMIHWVPLADSHPEHGVWGYSKDFFVELAMLNSYEVEKLYIETTFKNWRLVCCSLKKTSQSKSDFQWSEELQGMLVYNEKGSSGVDYS